MAPSSGRFQLTFDDGPSEFTYPILDLLNKHHVKATFFVVGVALVGHWNLLRRMLAHGHTIGNHTLTHSKLTDLGSEAIRLELDATSYLIGKATGEAPTVYRAPYLTVDERVQSVADTMNLTHVGADVDPHDWEFTDPAEIARRVLDRGSGVVCLHDGLPPGGGNGTASRQATVEAVRMILEATR